MAGISKVECVDDMMMISMKAANSSTMAKTLAALANSGVVVDMISQTAPQGDEIQFSFTAPFHYFDDAMNALKALPHSELPAPMISGGFSKIYLFDASMLESAGVAAKVLAILSGAGADIYMITTSDLDISILVRAEDADVATGALKNAFGVA